MKTKSQMNQIIRSGLLAVSIFLGGLSSEAANFTDNNWISMGVPPGADGVVRATALDGSGNLYLGGNFTSVGNASANRIAKWDGSNWSALGSGMNDWVFALGVSGTNLYAGGSFTNAGGVAAKCIAKWDGSSWSALGSGMGGSPFTAVRALAVSGSDLYAGGQFTSAGGVTANNIAKWTGTTWLPLGAGTAGGNNGEVRSLAKSGSDLYVGGWFTSAGNIPARYIAKWNSSSWATLGSGTTAEVNALVVSGGNVYAGGAFSSAGGIPALHVAKWNGSSWSSLGSGLGGAVGPFASPYVDTLAVSGNDLYVGGAFLSAGGVIANSIAKWNGSSWSALGSGMRGNSYSVYALVISGGEMYAGGSFTTAGGKVSPHLTRARLSFTPDNLALKANVPGAHTNTLTFAGVPNFPYIIQYATNLTSSPWLTLSTNAPDAKGLGAAVDPTATDPQRFYRVGYRE